MIELFGVCKSFDDVHALYPTDLEFPRGKTTVLIGPSGCGKSTLLKIIVGLIQPDSGSVRMDNVEVTPQAARRLRQRMGYVIQDGGLFPHLTARGNATLMARHLGWEPARIESRIEQLAELTHLPSEMFDRYPAQISGGQRQRVSLIRALFLDPDVLLLDEPLGSLDPMIRSDLQAELRQIFVSLNKTVVMVTHDIGEAGFLGDRIVLLRDGRIIQRGMLQDFVRTPADSFVISFINAQRTPLESLTQADS